MDINIPIIAGNNRQQVFGEQINVFLLRTYSCTRKTYLDLLVVTLIKPRGKITRLYI